MIFSLAFASQLLVFCSLAGSAFFGGREKVARADETHLYNIPNPFKDEQSKNGIFYIKSLQTSSAYANQDRHKQFEVEDYFTLRGLSFSLHRHPDDASNNYALVADGPLGRSYIVRNFDSPEGFECELDHLHQHRQVFPWQYAFDVEDPDEAGSELEIRRRSKRKQKNKWAKRRYVYGVGAIWLNAIERKLLSSTVGDNSVYPNSNSWEIKQHDLSLKLIFDKPQRDAQEGPEMEAAIEKSSLSSIELIKFHMLVPNQNMKTTNFETNFDHIIVKKFERNVQAPDHFKMILSECRKHAIQHRNFPNMLAAISSSPARLFNIYYIERRLSLSPDDKPDQYSKEQHRLASAVQYKSEWFSFRREAQVNIYQNLMDSHGLFLCEDGSMRDDPACADDGSLVDVFMKRFTERYVNKQNVSSNYLTAHYHFTERDDEILECHVGEHEPLPADHLMSRTVQFGRGLSSYLTGRLTGLTALLMNVAHIHYKQFELVRHNIWVSFDPFDPSARIQREVNTWTIYDKKLDRKILFHFLAPKNHYDQVQMSDLVRVDIRDNLPEEPSDSADSNSNPDEPFDANDGHTLLLFDIIQMNFEVAEQKLDLIFNPPKLCLENPTPSKDGVNDRDDDIDDNPKLDEEDEDEDYYNHFSDDDADYSDDDDSDHADEHQTDERDADADEFEFHPGNEAQTGVEFPNFYEFLDDQSSYTIRSKIQLLGSENSESKHIHLEEQVNLETEMAYYAIYFSDKNLNEKKPDIEHYINYNSELVFRLTRDEKYADKMDIRLCQLVPEAEPWLRLLSAPLRYYKVPQSWANKRIDPHNMSGIALVESSKIPIYGLGALWRYASESIDVEFLGVERKTVIGDQDLKYKRVRWLLNEDKDMEIVFQFLLDAQKSEAGEKEHHHHFGRHFELLKLDSVFISMIYNVADLELGNSKFRKFKISSPQVFGPLQSQEAGLEKLPEICLRALSEELAKRETQPEEDSYKDITTMPSFFDLVKETNHYYAFYNILYHSAGKTAKKVPVMESYDRKKNFGLIVIEPKLVTGREARELHIDGHGKRMFVFASESRICKRVTEFNPLPQLDSTHMLDIKNENFDLNKMFGLAAIWIQLAGKKVRRVRVSHKHDDLGNLLEVREFEISLEFPQERNSIDVFVTFAQASNVATADPFWSPSMAKIKSEPKFKLVKIDFRPVQGTRLKGADKGKESPHRVLIEVGSIHSALPGDVSELDLPAECQRLLADQDSSPDSKPEANGEKVTGDNFPRLMELIKHSNQFHMRSEVISSLESSKLDSIYLIDEWLYHKNIRYRTYGLSNNIDFLLYGNSREFFDLSVAYVCPKTAPKFFMFDFMGDVTAEGLLDFWGSPESSVKNLHQLYYSPVSLWYLAEKNLKDVKLVTSLDLAPQPSGNAKLDSMEREMRRETWRLSSPEGQEKPWSYDMVFEKMSGRDERGNVLREWHVLQKITITDSEFLNLKRKLEVEVINYRYDHTDEEMMRRFLLPEGYNCQRKPASVGENSPNRYNDELNLDLNSKAYSLSYEASLELLQSNQNTNNDLDAGEYQLGESREMMPSLVGEFVSLGGGQPRLFSEYTKLRHHNGTLQAQKRVFESGSMLTWKLDMLSGVCSMSRTGFVLSWTLAFESPLNSQAIVSLDKNKLNMLFLDTKENNFEPSNWYAADGLYTTTYELSLDNFRLMSGFSGPVTIVRRFQHPESHMPPLTESKAKGSLSKLHESVYTKVLMFDQERKRVLAVLRIGLRKAKANISTKDVLRATAKTLEQCYNEPKQGKRARHFFIDYVTGATTFWAGYYSRLLEEDFIEKVLLGEAALTLLQVEEVRLEIAYASRIRLYFKLLEGPSAAEYFVERQGFEMNELLEYQAEMNLVSSLEECSRWCDKLNCVALSYCSHRVCKVLTLTMLTEARKLSSPKGSRFPKRDSDTIQADDLILLEDTVQVDECSYFYRVAPTPKRLEHFSLFMDQLVNRGRPEELLRKYGLMFQDELVVPDKFGELKESFSPIGSLDGEQLAQQDAGGLERQISASEGFYRVHEKGSALDNWKIMELVGSKESEGSLKVEVSQAASYAECVADCSRQGCLAVSFCKSSSACTAVYGASRHLRRLMSVERVKQKGCTVALRDYLRDYTKFEDTRKPNKFIISELADYSPLECAATCRELDYAIEAESQSCLSFDFCQQTNTCYLQSAHLMTDDFDRSILSPKWHNENSSRSSAADLKLTCDHYSRNALADFLWLANKRFVKKQIFVLRGNQAKSSESCALECYQDPRCLAFEYCLSEGLKPAQACYFAGLPENGTGSEWNLQKYQSKEFLEGGLKFSRKCSVYILKHFREEFKFDASEREVSLFEAAGELYAKYHSSLYYFFVSLAAILGSLAVGSIIQFVYLKLMGEPLLFNNYY